jgi:hypothetical protein
MNVHAGWAAENQRLLHNAISDLREWIASLISPDAVIRVRGPVAGALSPPPAMERLRDGFGLTSFEFDVALLCAGIELDGSLAELIGALHGGGDARPTVELMLRVLPDASWSAFTPAAPLRRWQMIELDVAPTIATSPVRIDERSLHFLMGNDYLEPRLSPLLRRVEIPQALPEMYRRLVDRIVSRWAASDSLLCLEGSQRATVRTVGAIACAAMGLSLIVGSARAIAQFAGGQETLARLWEREAMFLQSALMIEDDSAGDPQVLASVCDLISRINGPIIVPPSLLSRSDDRPTVRLHLPDLSPAEQRSLWRHRLGPAAAALNGRMDEMIAQFPMNADQVADVLEQVAADDDQTQPLAIRLWDACRASTRTPMGRLAQRIEAGATWDDLVLPHDEMTQLRDIARHVRHRAKVHETWQFGARSGRGRGISALFAGPSGTGKTLAAEVLANDLRLDLYRIDLSQVVSKYIGETEKNLSAVFEAAEQGGAILLFDEADALFGKRSDVKDSHDRYANIEVSYLLQRMESYRGLAILTTNQRASLDQAFLRRLRFVVSFPFPDASQREAIWAHVFPQATPTHHLVYEQLARLNVTGGVIRNIALHAAFLAAADGRPVDMAHLQHAARSECRKIEKPIIAAEIGGWA